MDEFPFYGTTSDGRDRVGDWSMFLVPEHERQIAHREKLRIPDQQDFERRFQQDNQRITYGHVGYKGYFISVERTVRDPAAKTMPTGKYDLIVERRTEDGIIGKKVSICAMVDLWAAAGVPMWHINQLMRGEAVTDFGEPTNRAPFGPPRTQDAPQGEASKKRPMTNLAELGRPIMIRSLLLRARANRANSNKPSTIPPKEDVETLISTFIPDGGPMARRVTRRRSN